jgi:hypothetical protein
MTALCAGGGASSPQPSAPQKAVFTTAAIGVLLDSVGLLWLTPFLAAYAAPIVDTPTFCTADPPAITGLTGPDLVALARPLDDFNATGAALAKIDNLVKNVAWYQLCQCNAGAQPVIAVPPTAQPANPPQIIDGNAGLCVGMLRSQCKVLDLWNGVTNVAPPANWDQLSFNDSAWAAPGVPDANTPGVVGPVVTGFGISPACQTNTNCGAQQIAPWTGAAEPAAQFLVRWRFNLPASFDVNKICVSLKFDFANPGVGGWSTGLATVNNTGGVVFNALAWQNMVTHLVPGSNLIAFWINSGNGANANTWGAKGWISAILSIQSALYAPSTQGCCPPDPDVGRLLGAIYSAVTLIQRQAVPFGYVTSTAHPGIVNTGTIAIQGLIGVKINVTAYPGANRVIPGEPNYIYDLGWVSIETGDGFIDEVRIRNTTQVWCPRLMSEATKLGYYLRAGVTATFTELVREA